MVNSVDNEIITNTEILNILKKIDLEYIYKIPEEIIEYLNENPLKIKDEKYSGFDENGNIKVSKEAEEILIYLYLNYWADEDEKEKLIEKYKENEKQLSDKYDVYKVFEQRKRNTEDGEKKEVHLVEVKDNIFVKILNKIKMLLKKKD